MSYSITVPGSPAEIVNQIAVFAGANGWTVVRNVMPSTVRTVTLRLGSGPYLHIYHNSTEIRLRGSTGYDDTKTVAEQPGVALTEAISNLGTGPYVAMHLFGNAAPKDCIYSAIEVTSGEFRHVGFGDSIQIGSWSGGFFYDASQWTGQTPSPANFEDAFWEGNHVFFQTTRANGVSSGSIFLPLSGSPNYFAPSRQGVSGASVTVQAFPTVGGQTANDLSSQGRTVRGFFDRSVSSWSGVTPMQPIKLRVSRDSGYWSELCELPCIRFLNIARFSPGQEISVGGVVYKTFPWKKKGTDKSSSQSLGFAYLKTS